MTVLPSGPNRTFIITLSLNVDQQDQSLRKLHEWVVDLFKPDLEDDEFVVDVEWGPDESVTYE